MLPGHSCLSSRCQGCPELAGLPGACAGPRQPAGQGTGLMKSLFLISPSCGHLPRCPAPAKAPKPSQLRPQSPQLVPMEEFQGKGRPRAGSALLTLPAPSTGKPWCRLEGPPQAQPRPEQLGQGDRSRLPSSPPPGEPEQHESGSVGSTAGRAAARNSRSQLPWEVAQGPSWLKQDLGHGGDRCYSSGRWAGAPPSPWRSNVKGQVQEARPPGTSQGLISPKSPMPLTPDPWSSSLSRHRREVASSGATQMVFGGWPASFPGQGWPHWLSYSKGCRVP